MRVNQLSTILFIIWLSGCHTSSPSSNNTTTAHTLHHKTNKTIVIATGHWPPYTIAESQTGVFIDLTTEAFARAGITIEYRFYSSWARAEQDTLDGLAYAALPYYKTDERMSSFNFSAPVLDSRTGFFYYVPQHPDGIQYTELIDLRSYRIGGVLGYWYEPIFRQTELNVEYVPTEQQAIEKLYLGRVDLMPANHDNMKALVSEMYPETAEQFVAIEPLLSQQSLHLMVSRTYPNASELTHTFNQALEEMVNDGTYQQILAEYNLQ